MQAISLRRVAARAVDGIDGPLLTIALMLVALGLATLYSASYETPARLSAQMVNITVALGAMWVVARIPPQSLMRLAVPGYVLGLALLVLVALFGDIVNGARRWLNVGFGRFQPSEMMKLALPLMLAWHFHRNESALRLRDFAIAAVLLLLPVLLIARQPDLGTAILVGAAGFYVIFFAGLSWKVMAGLAVAGLGAMPVLWGLLHDYQRRRILTLLDPTTDPLGAGYHIIQSRIALGSGGVWGKGYLQGTQAYLQFLPERQTDFIFPMFAEEFGLAGALILIGLYALIIIYGLAIALRAQTQFGRLTAVGLIGIFFIYAFVNMAMVQGLMPVVGIPLPFMSYGGTAMMSLLISFGILISVYVHRDVRVGRRAIDDD